jgi:hypothetical protein
MKHRPTTRNSASTRPSGRALAGVRVRQTVGAGSGVRVSSAGGLLVHVVLATDQSLPLVGLGARIL